MLDRLRQQGSSKILFPGMPSAALTGIMLNTAGGITGGDEFEMSARASADCHMILTTQAAERAYRAQPGQRAQVTNRLWVDAGARMDWLPQETLIYDRSALRRSLDVDVAGDATLLAVEPVVFGRREMGEVLNDVTFHDRIDVRRDNQPVFADRTRLDGNAAQILGNAALGSACGAMASVLLVCTHAERFLAPARSLMPPTGGVSLIRDGVLFARILAQDGYALRQSLVPLIELLGAGPVPRTWIL